MPPCFSVVNLREIGGRKAGKTSRSEWPRRRHLDDGSFVRLPPVLTVLGDIFNLFFVFGRIFSEQTIVAFCQTNETPLSEIT